MSSKRLQTVVPKKVIKTTKNTTDPKSVLSKNNNNTQIDSDSDFYEESKYDEIKFTNKKIILNTINKEDKEDKPNITKIEVKSRSQPDYNPLLFSEDSEKSQFRAIKYAWSTLKKYKLPNQENYRIIKSHPGHYVNFGCEAGEIKNPHWLVYDKVTKEEYYIMYCETNAYTKFSKEDYTEVINPENNVYPSWHFHIGTGYISTRTYPNNNHQYYYLHQLICQKHQDKKFKTQSVDHMNRDKLDNRFSNLRFATQSQQNQNTEKRERKYNAIDLPKGIDHKQMPKYVGYKSENYGPDKKHFRDGFVIEKHPYQNILSKLKATGQVLDANFPSRWYTTKSMQISLDDKLKLAVKKRKDYDDEFKNNCPEEYNQWIKISGI
jgi:hypothetical protein